MEKLAECINKWKISSHFHDSTPFLHICLWCSEGHSTMSSHAGHICQLTIAVYSCMNSSVLIILINLFSNCSGWRKLDPEPLLTVKSAAEDCSKLNGNFLIDSFLSLLHSWLIVCAGCDPAISKSSNPQQCLLAGSKGSTAAH